MIQGGEEEAPYPIKKRPLSYSDSFLFTNGNSLQQELLLHQAPTEQAPRCHTTVLFILKGTLHILFISTFETIFYFMYVSKSEDDGIMTTINDYYIPALETCGNFSNATRSFILEILMNTMNQSVIDAEGVNAANKRTTFNENLLKLSIIYSLTTLGLSIIIILVINKKRIQVHWKNLMTEHISFVLLLGLYEFFFFKTIIYQYTTISTAELNKYILDGLYQCLGG